jgi:hypothetical protein
MEKIAQKAASLKKDTWMVTLTHQLPFSGREGDAWALILSVELEMSWGSSKIYVHQK